MAKRKNSLGIKMLKHPQRKLRNPVERMREQWEGQAQRVSGSLRTLGQKPRRPPEALPVVLGGEI